MKLYCCETSYASQKVTNFLDYYSIEVDKVHINLRKQENITTNFREINPKGTVPILLAKDCTLYTSTNILIYLSKHIGINPPTKVINFCSYDEKIHDPYLRLLSYINIFTLNIDPKKKEALEKLAKIHPWKERGDFLLRLLSGKIQQEEIETAKKVCMSRIEEIRNLIFNQHILATGTFQISDSVAIAFLSRMAQINLITPLESSNLLKGLYNRK